MDIRLCYRKLVYYTKTKEEQNEFSQGVFKGEVLSLAKLSEQRVS